MLTLQELKNSVPENLRKAVNQEILDIVNGFSHDEDFYQSYMSNLVTYHDVLMSGRFKMTDYFSAVQYVSYRLQGKTNFDSYCLTFPDRYKNHLANGISAHQIAAYVSMYNKNTLVTSILKQAVIPIYISHAHLLYEALDVQYAIMTDTKVSPKTRSDAAAHLMNHLTPPKESKIQIDLGVSNNGVMDQLLENMANLVDMQYEAIKNKDATAQNVIETKLIQNAEVS